MIVHAGTETYLSDRDLHRVGTRRSHDDRVISLTRWAGAGQKHDALDWAHLTEMKIKDFGYLITGWDSYGAPEVTSTAIATAVHMVDQLKNLPWHPFVGPTSDGGVQFEWVRGESYLSYEVLPGGAIEVAYAHPDGREWLGPLGEEPDDLQSVYVALLESR